MRWADGRSFDFLTIPPSFYNAKSTTKHITQHLIGTSEEFSMMVYNIYGEFKMKSSLEGLLGCVRCLRTRGMVN